MTPWLAGTQHWHHFLCLPSLSPPLGASQNHLHNTTFTSPHHYRAYIQSEGIIQLVGQQAPTQASSHTNAKPYTAFRMYERVRVCGRCSLRGPSYAGLGATNTVRPRLINFIWSHISKHTYNVSFPSLHSQCRLCTHLHFQ